MPALRHDGLVYQYFIVESIVGVDIFALVFIIKHWFARCFKVFLNVGTNIFIANNNTIGVVYSQFGKGKVSRVFSNGYIFFANTFKL